MSFKLTKKETDQQIQVNGFVHILMPIRLGSNSISGISYFITLRKLVKHFVPSLPHL